MKKLVFLFLITCGYLTAQVTTSSISGVIVDDAIELEGANVVATHIPTGTTYGAVTNQDGRFNMVNMRVGVLIKLA